jgi:hypothetical protein
LLDESVAIAGAALAVLLLLTGAAEACPGCSTSRLVTALVLSGGVWRHLAVTVAPFLTLAVVVAVIRRTVR